MGRGDSCQSCSRQGLIRGDPSLVLTCMVGHPHPPTPFLCFLDRSVVANEPMWVPMWRGGKGAGRIMAMPSGHLSDGRGQGRPAPDQTLDGQNPFDRWLEHGSGPWAGRGEDTAIRVDAAPGWRVQTEFQGVGWGGFVIGKRARRWGVELSVTCGVVRVRYRQLGEEVRLLSQLWPLGSCHHMSLLLPSLQNYAAMKLVKPFS